jgi:pimeloyl-ACP methyl ester carboxylesterase
MPALVADWQEGHGIDTCCRKKIVCGAGLASFSGDATHHFGPLRRHLIGASGFDAEDFVEMSYAGWTHDGAWTPRPYHVTDVQGPIDCSAEAVARQLEWYRVQLPNAVFYLAGYSLGGVIAFEAAGRLLAHDIGAWRDRLAGVALLSSPLLGVDFGSLRGIAKDIAAGPDGYGKAGAELLARAGDFETLDRLEVTAALLRASGVRLLIVWDRNDSVVEGPDAILPSALTAHEVVAVEAPLPPDADHIARRFGHGPVLSDPRTLTALARLIGQQECTGPHKPRSTSETVESELEALKAKMRREGRRV